MNMKKQNNHPPAGRCLRRVGIGAALVLAAVVIVIYFLMITTSKGIIGKDKGLNLMVITLDTTRADRIGAYGYKPAETPNLDYLAANGILFENCYIPVPITLPSHCSIFTGRYPPGHRVRANGTHFLGEGENTLAEMMKSQGYQTYAVIASYVLLAKFGLNQGFDFYDDSLKFNEMITNFGSEIQADQVYSKFSHWFKKRSNPGERFFAWIHFFDPHRPYKPPARYKEKFGSNPEDLYNGEIAFMDAYIGKIIHLLKSADLLEQTLIIIVGDHGEAFGEHQTFGHSIFCYEENLKVPLIFYSPRLFSQKHGLRVKQRVSSVDIMPTIMELYGQEIPGEIHGKSLVNLLIGEKDKKERTFYVETMHGRYLMGWAPLTGIIHEQYKYISAPEPELYDLAADIEEKNNLFQKKNQLAKSLDKKLMNLVAMYSAGQEGEVPGSKRQLTKDDVKHLQSLGYISAFSTKANTNLDPKKGITFVTQFLEISELIRQGNLDHAEARLKKIVKNNPKTRFVHYYDLMALIYRKKQDNEGIVRNWQEAIKAFPENETFKDQLAGFFFYLNRLEESEALAIELIKNNPKYTAAYILRGRIAERSNRIAAALGYFETALRLEPRNISLKINYARLLGRNHQVPKAIEILEELLNDEEVLKDPKIKLKIERTFSALRR